MVDDEVGGDMVEAIVIVVNLVVIGVVEVDFVYVDVVVGVNEDYLINDLIRFDTYHRLDLDHRP